MRRFCEEYLVDLNATKAAERAGYSKRTANEQGAMLMKAKIVAETIQGLMNERSERTKLTADRVLEEIAQIALVDLGEAYDAGGTLLPVTAMPEHLRRSLASVESRVETHGGEKIGEVQKIRLLDKLRALELYGKHLELFTDKIKHSGAVEIAGQLAAARERVRKGKG